MGNAQSDIQKDINNAISSIIQNQIKNQIENEKQKLLDVNKQNVKDTDIKPDIIKSQKSWKLQCKESPPDSLQPNIKLFDCEPIKLIVDTNIKTDTLATVSKTQLEHFQDTISNNTTINYILLLICVLLIIYVLMMQ